MADFAALRVWTQTDGEPEVEQWLVFRRAVLLGNLKLMREVGVDFDRSSVARFRASESKTLGTELNPADFESASPTQSKYVGDLSGVVTAIHLSKRKPRSYGF